MQTENSKLKLVLKINCIMQTKTNRNLSQNKLYYAN